MTSNFLHLNDLVKNYITTLNIENPKITHLSSDTRTLKKGDLFFALGTQHIDEAIQKGAIAIICDQEIGKKNIPVVTIKALREKMGAIAAQFYNHPSQAMKTIMATGTNGKTSCTQYIAQVLNMAHIPTAVIGTLGNGKPNDLKPSTHTTPDAIQIQQLLAEFRDQEFKAVAIEATSHGIVQKRLNGTHADIAIFTNLTRDHLDYHQTMENYAKAKRELFNFPNLKYGILNADDAYGRLWLNELHPRLNVYAFGTQMHLTVNQDIPFIHAHHIESQPHGIKAEITTPWGEGILQTHLLGKFNLSNLLAVVTTLGILGLPLADILRHIKNLTSVPGRMQTLGGDEQKPLVVIDFAHTPDALAKTLQELRTHCQGELWCVFGCGGDRDKGKRPEMGKIAGKYADQVIITDDNPRSEDPIEITTQIRAGVPENTSVIIEHDRHRAIAHAIACADSRDVILIAGKGHETHQLIGTEKIPFSDFLEAKILLANKED